MATIVRALWGDEYILNWPNAMRDVQWHAVRKQSAAQELGCKEMIVAFGEQNCRFLQRFDFKPVLAGRSPVIQSGRRRFGREMDSLGHMNYGRSIWQHKLYAIKYAFQHGSTEVVWLDWDTVWDAGQSLEDAMHASYGLLGGPGFQGRIRSFLNIGPRYGGACLYFGHPRVLDTAIAIAQSLPYADDQTLLTLAANEVYFGARKDVSAAEHREKGLDNPRLFSTKANAISSDIVPVFSEATIDRKLPRFSRRNRMDRKIRLARVNCLVKA